MARIRVGHKEITLGKWGAPETHRRYGDFIVEYLRNYGCTAPPPPPSSVEQPFSTCAQGQLGPELSPEVAAAPAIEEGEQSFSAVFTVAELCVRYLEHAQSYYKGPDGRLTSSIGDVNAAIRTLADYDELPAAQFSPLLFKRLMHSLVGKPSGRKGPDGQTLAMPRVTINRTLKSIRRMFKWAVSEDLIPASVYQALDAVDLLAKGRTVARELPPVEAVSDEVVQQTLPHLPKVIRDMVRIQRLIGCRPGELCRLTPGEVDCSQDVWIWKPTHHKTSWRDDVREICIGPRAQEILRHYMTRGASVPCFLPSESEAARNAERRAARRSPMTPSQAARRRKAARRKPSMEPYNEKAYCRAIARACSMHDIPRWSPNQLRHAAACEARESDGLDSAQARLGHKNANITQLYAKLSTAKAMKVALRMG